VDFPDRAGAGRVLEAGGVPVCGRIVRANGDGYGDAFELAEISEHRITPRFNIAPTQLDLMIRDTGDGRVLVESRWGLIPPWAKDRTVGGRMFNARAETLAERPAFRGLIARHRCIVPASGFYEWRQGPRGKTPLYIHRADGKPLALAGLWTVWQDPEGGGPVTSHTIITCPPNRFMAAIHDRMPVVLDGDALHAWLDPTSTELGSVLALLGPCPEDLLDAYAVAPLVNNVRAEGPELIRPVPA
jgi:putative SOS response-associated peptidase YedK